MKSRSSIKFMIAFLVATLVIGIAGSPVIAARAKESAGAERRRIASVSSVVLRQRKRPFKLTNRSCESGCIESYKSYSLALALEFERSDPGKEAMYGIEAR